MERKRAYVYPSNPYDALRKESLISRWYSPSSVGTATAAALVLASRFFTNVPLSNRAVCLRFVPVPLLLITGGFTLGYSSVKVTEWIRWKIVKSMFSYLGWISNPKSYKTKVSVIYTCILNLMAF